MKQALRRIRYILSLRCDEASRLTSDSLDRPLLTYEKIALSGHRLVCKSCQRLEQQLQGIRDTCLQGHQTDSITGSQDGLGEASKERLLSAIRHQDPEDPG